jgi:hypothetical protein
VHVRGFTQRANSGVAPDRRGTFAGVIEKIPYLRELGVTAVELLPIHQFDPQEGNYWGYMPLNFFALHQAYARAQDPPDARQEFRAMVDEMPELTTYMPDIRRHLLEFPKYTLPNATSFLYWQETEFGLRPTLRISHVTIRETPDDIVVTSKMLYASHYFWTGLELRVLLPDPSRGAGFWFLTVNRSRSDGLSGFTGAFIRPRARGEAQNGAMAALKLTKQKLEASPK